MKKLLIYVLLFGVQLSCTQLMRHFAAPIAWVPKHNYTLGLSDQQSPILLEKVPLELSISFDTAWNQSNKPHALDRWEDYGVKEEMIHFLIKDIRVEGGNGKLFFREKDKEGNWMVAKPFTTGIKVKKGITHLYYIPDQNNACQSHTIHISAVILTVDFGREGGKPATFSLQLNAPAYTTSIEIDRDLAYIEDGAQPFCLKIDSSNSLATRQKYTLNSWNVSGGEGTLFRQGKSGTKPVYVGMPLSYGENQLFYLPKKGSEGSHTLHIEVNNQSKIEEVAFSLKVLDHQVVPFSATLSKQVTDTPILPFRKSHFRLSIDPENQAGKGLHYQIQSIKLDTGKLLLNGKLVVDGTPIKVGSNSLVFDPEGKLGNIGLCMMVCNSKGDLMQVAIQDPLEVTDPNFKVTSVIVRESINLQVSSPKHTSSDQWTMKDFTLLGGIEGKLRYPTGNTVGKRSTLQLGNNYFTFVLGDLYRFIDKIQGPPKLEFSIIYPDEKTEVVQSVDLSSFLVSAIQQQLVCLSLEAKNLYAPLVENYSIDHAIALRDRSNQREIWYAKQKKLLGILGYLRYNTIASDQAGRTIVSLNKLAEEIQSYTDLRFVATEWLHNSQSQLDKMISYPDSRENSCIVGVLSTSIQAKIPLFDRCQSIEGLQDLSISFSNMRKQVQAEQLRPTCQVEPVVHADQIHLTITPPPNIDPQTWIVQKLTFSDGLKGRLLTPMGSEVTEGSQLRSGDNVLKFDPVDQQSWPYILKEGPKIEMVLTYPDGRTSLPVVMDLSSFLWQNLDQKLTSWQEKAEEVWAPVMDDYKNNPIEPCRALADKKEKWDQEKHQLTDLLHYIRENTPVTVQVNRALTCMDQLAETTKSNMDKRMITTKMLCNWHKDIHTISSNKDPKGRKEYTVYLESKIREFNHALQSCSQIPGMEDIHGSFEDLQGSLRLLKNQTMELYNEQQAKEDQLQTNLNEIKRSVESERNQSNYDIGQLENNIQSTAENLDSEFNRLHNDLGDRVDDLEYDMPSLKQGLKNLEKELDVAVNDLHGINYRVNNNTKWWSKNKTGSLKSKSKSK